MTEKTKHLINQYINILEAKKYSKKRMKQEINVTLKAIIADAINNAKVTRDFVLMGISSAQIAYGVELEGNELVFASNEKINEEQWVKIRKSIEKSIENKLYLKINQDGNITNEKKIAVEFDFARNEVNINDIDIIIIDQACLEPTRQKVQFNGVTLPRGIKNKIIPTCSLEEAFLDMVIQICACNGQAHVELVNNIVRMQDSNVIITTELVTKKAEQIPLEKLEQMIEKSYLMRHQSFMYESIAKTLVHLKNVLKLARLK